MTQPCLIDLHAISSAAFSAFRSPPGSTGALPTVWREAKPKAESAALTMFPKDAASLSAAVSMSFHEVRLPLGTQNRPSTPCSQHASTRPRCRRPVCPPVCPPQPRCRGVTTATRTRRRSHAHCRMLMWCQRGDRRSSFCWPSPLSAPIETPTKGMRCSQIKFLLAKSCVLQSHIRCADLPAIVPTAEGADTRRPDCCRFPDTPSPSVLKHLLKGEGCAAK